MPGRKKSPDYRALDLSEKSSHSAASIARAPDSHCCQLRCVRCTKAEAAAVESPASSRACRISDGDGLAKVRPLFITVLNGHRDDLFEFNAFAFVELFTDAYLAANGLLKLLASNCFRTVKRLRAGLDPKVSSGSCYVVGHDFLLLIGLRCATHDSTVANDVRLCKSYFASNENNFVRAA